MRGGRHILEITMTTILFATAGRVTGLAYAHTRRVVALIDWAEVAAIVWHGLVTLAVMTYLAGEFTGRTLHQLNDRLTAVWSRLWAPQPEVSAKPAAKPILAAPVQHPLAMLADELMLCTRRELNAITGIRSKAAKHALVAAYVAA